MILKSQGTFLYDTFKFRSIKMNLKSPNKRKNKKEQENKIEFRNIPSLMVFL